MSCCKVLRRPGANYYCRIVEEYAEMAEPLTALGGLAAYGTPASFDALYVLRTFDPARRAVLTTDASNVAVEF